MSTEEVFLQPPAEPAIEGITFAQYAAPSEVNEYKQLNDSILSEAYSVYTYHFFVDLSPTITYSARNQKGELVGVCICKRDILNQKPFGYIGMLSVLPPYRGKGIAKALVIRCINQMIREHYTGVYLETEYDNAGALRLYEKMGFRRTEFLTRYYQNGNNAYRLMLQLEGIFFPCVEE